MTQMLTERYRERMAGVLSCYGPNRHPCLGRACGGDDQFSERQGNAHLHALHIMVQ